MRVVLNLNHERATFGYLHERVLILASASPRRHELLLAAGIPHLVRPASVAEDRYPGESPRAFVQRLAEEKARAVTPGPGDIVLGADTVVAIGPEVLGKPDGDQDACRMLRLLAGREHSVYTGICILCKQRCVVDLAATRVQFAELSEEEIQEYIRTGEPRDKAGAYAIQGLASRFVTSIAGCYQNVVGLPVSLVYRYLKAI